MSAPVRSEVLKLRTTRTTIGLLLATVGLVLLTTVVPFLVAGTESASDLSLYDEPTQRSVFLAPGAATLFATIVGVLAFTSEFRHGTIRPTFVAVPGRLRVVIAKTVAAMLAGAVLGVVAVAATDVVAIPWLEAKGYPRWVGDTELVQIGAGVVTASALWAIVGVGVGALLRSQVVAVVAVVVWGLVESLVSAFAPRVGRLSPGEAANALMGSDGDALLPPLAGLAVLAAWATAFALAGAVAIHRRDVP